MLPGEVERTLRSHLIRVRNLHEQDLAQGFGRVWMPHALERKLASSSADWVWQYVKPTMTRRTMYRRLAARPRHRG